MPTILSIRKRRGLDFGGPAAFGTSIPDWYLVPKLRLGTQGWKLRFLCRQDACRARWARKRSFQEMRSQTEFGNELLESAGPVAFGTSSSPYFFSGVVV